MAIGSLGTGGPWSRGWARCLRRALVAGMAALASMPAQAAQSCAPSNFLMDGGFELSTGSPPLNPHWVETSTKFGSPICTLTACLTHPGTAPRTGVAWVWFGGSVSALPETATLAQTVTIPVATSAFLELYLNVAFVTPPFDDVVHVKVDGNVVGSFVEPAVADPVYAPYSFPLTAFADGLPHEIGLEYIKPGSSGRADFNLDDIRLEITQEIQFEDGDFEGATGIPLDSPGWFEASVEFLSPLCSLAACGTNGGTAGPHSGDVWAWFGGSNVDAAESASIEQAIRVPLGARAALSHWLWRGRSEAPFTDTLTMSVDDVPLFTIGEPSTPDPGYIQYVSDLNAFGDGAAHRLRFQYEKPQGGGKANFSVDDLELVASSCDALLIDGFETHDASNWSALVP